MTRQRYRSLYKNSVALQFADRDFNSISGSKTAKDYWEELLEGKYEWSSMGKLLRKKGLVK